MRSYTNRIQDKRKECSIKGGGSHDYGGVHRAMRDAESIYKLGVFGAGTKIERVVCSGSFPDAALRNADHCVVHSV